MSYETNQTDMVQVVRTVLVDQHGRVSTHYTTGDFDVIMDGQESRQLGWSGNSYPTQIAQEETFVSAADREVEARDLEPGYSTRPFVNPNGSYDVHEKNRDGAVSIKTFDKNLNRVDKPETSKGISSWLGKLSSGGRR